MAREANANAFPINLDTAGLTSGTHTVSEGQILDCIVSGSVTFTSYKAQTYTEVVAEGKAYELSNIASVTIVDGTFHIG